MLFGSMDLTLELCLYYIDYKIGHNLGSISTSVAYIGYFAK
jgi:hypothetical protein